jgi:hypothetical protein
MMPSPRSSRLALAAAAGLIAALGGCSNGVPLGPSDTATQATAAKSQTPTTTPTPTTPAPPAPTFPTTPTAVAYTDLIPMFASDCTPCHGVRSPAGRYSTASYASVMAAVKAGSASSALVIVTQPGGVMYGFLSGDRTGKAALIRTWVLNGAPESR